MHVPFSSHYIQFYGSFSPPHTHTHIICLLYSSYPPPKWFVGSVLSPKRYWFTPSVLPLTTSIYTPCYIPTLYWFVRRVLPPHILCLCSPFPPQKKLICVSRSLPQKMLIYSPRSAPHNIYLWGTHVPPPRTFINEDSFFSPTTSFYCVSFSHPSLKKTRIFEHPHVLILVFLLFDTHTYPHPYRCPHIHILIRMIYLSRPSLTNTLIRVDSSKKKVLQNPNQRVPK